MVTSLVTPGTAACAGHAEPYQVCGFFLVFFNMEGCSNAAKLPYFIISKVEFFLLAFLSKIALNRNACYN